MWKSWPSLAVSVAVGVVLAGGALTMIGSIANARPVSVASSTASSMGTRALENALASLAGSSLKDDLAVRRAINVVHEQLRTTNIRAGQDFFTAAQIAMKGSTADDALLAHDLACCALALGESKSKSIVAASFDQYLVRMGRHQRFGTQAGYAVDGAVTSGMRFIMGVEGNRSSAPTQPVTPVVEARKIDSSSAGVRINAFVGN